MRHTHKMESTDPQDSLAKENAAMLRHLWNVAPKTSPTRPLETRPQQGGGAFAGKASNGIEQSSKPLAAVCTDEVPSAAPRLRQEENGRGFVSWDLESQQDLENRPSTSIRDLHASARSPKQSFLHSAMVSHPARSLFCPCLFALSFKLSWPHPLSDDDCVWNSLVFSYPSISLLVISLSIVHE